MDNKIKLKKWFEFKLGKLNESDFEELNPVIDYFISVHDLYNQIQKNGDKTPGKGGTKDIIEFIEGIITFTNRKS